MENFTPYFFFLGFGFDDGFELYFVATYTFLVPVFCFNTFDMSFHYTHFTLLKLSVIIIPNSLITVNFFLFLSTQSRNVP
jgi:hypothetical protein